MKESLYMTLFIWLGILGAIVSIAGKGIEYTGKAIECLGSAIIEHSLKYDLYY